MKKQLCLEHVLWSFSQLVTLSEPPSANYLRLVILMGTYFPQAVAVNTQLVKQGLERVALLL